MSRRRAQVIADDELLLSTDRKTAHRLGNRDALSVSHLPQARRQRPRVRRHHDERLDDVAQRPQRRRVQVVADADDGPLQRLRAALPPPPAAAVVLQRAALDELRDGADGGRRGARAVAAGRAVDLVDHEAVRPALAEDWLHLNSRRDGLEQRGLAALVRRVDFNDAVAAVAGDDVRERRLADACTPPAVSAGPRRRLLTTKGFDQKQATVDP